MKGVSTSSPVTNQEVNNSETGIFGRAIRWCENRRWNGIAALLSKITGIPLSDREDQSTIRRGTSPQTMAAMCNLIIFLSHSLGTSLVDFICLCSRSHSAPPNLLTEN
ncbi:MAG: hypothetical protein LBF49_03380 [Puniceicoccales bacterium]|nr:hypothetical protein [Puniceicoccales bacterium]